jgi:hypothetical protein
MWPMPRNSSATIDSVRTTPFTCGRHASDTISTRAGDAIAAAATATPAGLSASGNSGDASGARGEE